MNTDDPINPSTPKGTNREPRNMNDDTPIRAALAELVACDEIRRTLRVDLNKDSYEEFRKRSAAAWENARRLALAATEPAEPPRLTVAGLAMASKQKMQGIMAAAETAGEGSVTANQHLTTDQVLQAVAHIAEQSRSASSLTESAAREPPALARFGHHPDPVIDFCVEVEAIEAEVIDLAAGLPATMDLSARIFKAMSFRAGVDERALSAKAALRKIEAATEIRTAPSEPADGIQAKRLGVIVWLLERRDNAQRIAMHKSGADKAGWLEDAGYFNAAANLVNSLAALRPSAVLEAAPLTDERATKIWNEAYEASQAYYRGKHEPAHFSAVFVREVLARASTPSPSPTGEKP